MTRFKNRSGDTGKSGTPEMVKQFTRANRIVSWGISAYEETRDNREVANGLGFS